MNKKTRSHTIDTIFVLIIFSAFAVSVLMVLMLGAGIYRNINDITRETENERIALSYVRTKIRGFDNAGAVYTAPLQGVSALHIIEDIGGTEYKTVIYNHNGWLCEIFSEASIDMSPQDGMRVIQIEDLRFEQQDSGVIKVISGDLSLMLTLRSGNYISASAGGES